MHVQGIVILLAAFGAGQAQASSIEAPEPLTGAATSIVMPGEDLSIDPSIVAAVSETGPSPSIVVLADTPDAPSIITLGEPEPAGEEVAATPPTQRMMMPTVIRGGEVGEAAARPSPEPAQAAAPSGEPLLDPNDRGTPAKRKALKRQEERLAREAAAGTGNPQSDPSTEPEPLGW